MNRIKTVAVVGLGIGRSHLLEGYAKHRDKFHVLALCDLDEARLAKVGDEFGVERRTTSFDAVLSMPDVDIVDVCTPPMIHKPQVLAALAAGKHVVCEKPLVGSLADVDAVIAAEKIARGSVMPIFQYRWGTGFRKASRLVHYGFAGKPFVATAETHWKRAADYYAVPWRGRYDTELGGVLLTQAIHLHDMMCELMGPIASLSAYTTTRVNPIEVEDCASAALRFASGALGTLSATLGGANEISRLRLTFEHVTMESGLEPYAPGNDPWTFIARDPSRQQELDAIVAAVSPVKPRFEGQMEDYHAALLAGGPLPVTLADSRRSLELITALYDSAERESVVMLPLPADHPKAGSWRPNR
ncbi:MAG: Gfo/Idh/MocA family oxidoreductase [Burkholderiales bacterium]|nr:Gfo/Idh/MocA family oxidoreductase [Burkholderiales bacterium]